MRRINRDRKSKTLPLVLLLVLISFVVAALVITKRTHSVANDVLKPVGNAALDAVRPIGSFFAHGFDYGSLQKQNEQLQHAVGQLKQEQAETQFEKAQLHALQVLEHLSFVHGNTVFAETIDENVNEFTATITVDKGSADGVLTGFAVVAPGGLVGEIKSETKHTSLVRLITDGQSKVGVSFGPSEQYGAVAVGQGPDNKMTAAFVGINTPVHAGERFVTSALQAASLPSGIPVATVASVHTPAGASQKAVVLRPTVANLDGPPLYVAIVQSSP